MRAGSPPVLVAGPWGVGKRAEVVAAAAAAGLSLVSVDFGVGGGKAVVAATAEAAAARGGCVLLLTGLSGIVEGGGAAGTDGDGGVGLAVAELIAPTRYRRAGAEADPGGAGGLACAGGAAWVVVVGVTDEAGGKGDSGGVGDDSGDEAEGSSDSRPPVAPPPADASGPGPPTRLTALFRTVVHVRPPSVAAVGAHLGALLPGCPPCDVSAVARLLPPATTLPGLTLAFEVSPPPALDEAVDAVAAAVLPPPALVGPSKAVITAPAAVPLCAIGGSPPTLAALLSASAVPQARPDLYPP